MKFFKVFILTILFATTGCDEANNVSPNATDTSCTNNIVVIQVMDGFLRSACGCNEGTQAVSSGNTLTCTFATGKKVIFHAISTKHTRQLEIQSFGVGPVWNPTSDEIIQSYGIHVNTAGSYNFSDRFIPGVSGTLVAL